MEIDFQDQKSNGLFRFSKGCFELLIRLGPVFGKDEDEEISYSLICLVRSLEEGSTGTLVMKDHCV